MTKITLTCSGKLLEHDTIETPQGLRATESDLTALAHQYLHNDIHLEPGATLSSIFELLQANPLLREIHRRNWANEYLERYQALRAGTVKLKEERRADEPKIEALVLTPKIEITAKRDVLQAIVNTTPNAPSEQNEVHTLNRTLPRILRM